MRLRSGFQPREELIEAFKVRVTGPLASHVEGVLCGAGPLGLRREPVRDHCYVLVNLSRGLAAERLEPSERTSPVVERFLCARRRAGYRRWRSVRSLGPLLDYLREVTEVSARQPPAAEYPVDRLLNVYRHHDYVNMLRGVRARSRSRGRSGGAW
jgi:hypothetical protein